MEKEFSAPICIAQALIALMENTPINDIRIKAIIKKAGVSRMSYYRYFTKKKDVLRYYMDHIIEEYCEQIDGKDGSSFQSYEHVLKALQFFYKYRDFILCLDHADMAGIVLEGLNRYVEKQQAFAEGNTYSFYFYAGALYNVYMQWISKGAVEAPEEIAKMITENCLNAT